MLTLAVATRAETFERMADPLAERGIAVSHLPVDERVHPLVEPVIDPDDYDVGFVHPSRLYEGEAVSALADLEWLNDREAILTSRNKAGVLARCARAGLSVPETVLVSTPADREDVLAAFDSLEPPVVVKPNSTTRGVGIAKAHDRDSLAGIVDYLELVHDYRATGDRSYLLQEYLPEARDYRVMTLEGEYVGAVERHLPEEAREAGRWKHNVHRGATATAVDLPVELRELAEAVARELSIPLLGVDLLVSGDRAVVSETNARPTIDDAAKYEDGFYDRLAEAIRTRAPVEE